jgi:hypothetical protein
MNLAECGHIVNILPPIDITGGKKGDIFTMKTHVHASILLAIGVSADKFTSVKVNACKDFAGTDAEAIPFSVYKEETADGDTLGARVDVEKTGFEPSANNDIIYVIELDAAQLPEGKPCVELELTNGANSVIASAVAILSGSRYAGDQSATAIA